MAQSTDVEIGGAGYMLAAGSYRRTQDAPGPGPTAGGFRSERGGGRVVVRRFAGGQRQAFADAEDRSWDGTGVGPVVAGQTE